MFVIVVVCLLVIIWLLVAQAQVQQALQWWYHRQCVRLCNEAEAIRDGRLQEAFIIRRYLELSLFYSEENSMLSVQAWLSTIEHLHNSLRELSDYLSPPYLNESLPLAIQQVVESWKVRYPAAQFSVELPADCQPQSYDRSRIVLTTLDELLYLVMLEGVPTPIITICLNLHQPRHQLMVQFAYPNSLTPSVDARSSELEHLSRAFCFLTWGGCTCRRTQQTITWYFRWHDTKEACVNAPYPLASDF